MMLRLARTLHQRDRRRQPLPGRRRGAELCRQRPDPARRAVRGTLDPAGRRRRRRRARRGAVRPGISCEGQPRTSTGRHDAMQGALLGPALRQRGDRAVPQTSEAPYVRLDDDGPVSTAVARRSPQARSSAGSRAEWSSARGRLGRRSILGDAAQSRDAVGDEPQDQVPRIVPAVRAVGPAGARRATTSRWTPRAPTCCSSLRCVEKRRTAMTAGSRSSVGYRAAERAALRHPRGDARRLFGPHPDGPRGDATRAIIGSSRRSRRRPGARAS